jgi:peptide-methionine (R)-S-oxide reductase
MYEKQVVLNPDCNPFLSNILLILRYLDDIFVIYTGTQEELLEFHAYLNSMNEHLPFSINYDLLQICFPGVMVIQDKTSLSADLYRKPMDRITLLSGDSFHPRSLIQNLTISQFMLYPILTIGEGI